MAHPLPRRRSPPTLLGTGLYAITNGPRIDLVDAARAALAGGARVLQYRDKTEDQTRRLSEARALATLCTQEDVPLIIDDDVELALQCGAAGVHLGEHDSDVATARARLGRDAIIGVSCYDSLGRARETANAGAGYLAFGAFFPSSTKRGAHRARIDLLRKAKVFDLPLVAIGGITPDNGAPLVATGADYLAVVSALFDAPDIEAAARRFAKLYDTGD